MPPASRFVHSAAVDASPVSDRVVLYERESRRAIVLNPTGTWLWGLLQSPCTAAELAQQLRLRFPHLDAMQAQRDIENYLRELEQQKLIQSQSAAS